MDANGWRSLYRKDNIRYEPWNGSYLPLVTELENYFFSRRYDLNTLITDYHAWSAWIPVTVLYILLIASMQRAMVDKPRYNLRLAMILWNAGLAMFSLVMFYRIMPEFADLFVSSRAVDDGLYKAVCMTRFSESPVGFWILLFGFSKVLELGDTVFLVLKKRPLIFLHYFHHIATMAYVFYCALDWNSGARVFMVMNSFVHVLMYGYFAVKAAGWKVPILVSMVITLLQFAQMIVGTFINIKTIMWLREGRYCEATFRNVAMCFIMYGMYVVLFGHFFVKAYVYKDQKMLRGTALAVQNAVNKRLNVPNGKAHVE